MSFERTITDLARRVDALARRVEQAIADPRRPMDAGRRAVAAIPGFVVSSTSTGTNQWEYTVAAAVGGGASGITGETVGPSLATKARNRWEVLAKAGYVTSGVTTLRPIPNNAPILMYPSTRNGLPIYLFTERNEVSC